MNLPANASRQTQLIQRILVFISQRAEPCSESEILSAVSGRRKDKINSIRLLRSEGAIAFIGTVKKGSPFLYFVPTLNAQTAVSESTPKEISVEPSPQTEPTQTFKTYRLSDGNVLSLSREEFDEGVELFRLLLRQSDKNAETKSQLEKETSEPMEKQTCSNSKEMEEA